MYYRKKLYLIYLVIIDFDLKKNTNKFSIVSLNSINIQLKLDIVNL